MADLVPAGSYPPMDKMMVLVLFRQRRSRVSSADDGHSWEQNLVWSFVADGTILQLEAALPI